MLKKIAFASGVLFIGLAYMPAYAARPQELFISGSGQISIQGAEVMVKNAVNMFVVEVWGQRWTVFADYATKFESGSGEAMKPEDILVGHVLSIKGKPLKGTLGGIDASVVRDLSLQAASASPASDNSIESLICSRQVAASIEKTKTETTSSLQAASLIGGMSALKSKTVILGTSPARDASQNMANTPVLARDLQYGMRGNDVELVQTFLQLKGYDIGVAKATGYYGAATREAVRQFQSANNLSANGRVGPKTRGLIQSLLSKQ